MARLYHYDHYDGLAPEKLSEIPCPVCLGEARDFVADDNGFTITRCRTQDCRFVYVNPRPNAEELATFYDKFYGPGDVVPEMWEVEIEDIVRDICDWLCADRPAGTVLDIGCSFGHLLVQMERQGWKTVGVDPSAVAADYARRHLAGEVIVADFEDAALAPGSFDAVVSLYVLEHVPDPRGFVEKIHRVLVPGGQAVIRMPFTSPLFWLHKVLRRPLMYAPMHLNDFSPMAIERLARGLGFRQVEVRVGRPRKSRDLVENVGARLLGGVGRAVERASGGRLTFPYSGAFSYRLWK